MLSTFLRLSTLMILLLGSLHTMAEPLAEIQTSEGLIVVDLNSEKAPNSVANFIRYAKEGHYAGTIFHRVIAGFMIQGGGLDTNFEPKPTHPPIRNEADNGLTNATGTIAMARTSDPHSASDQFFINVANNASLNFSERSSTGWGYTVFGRVIKGMDVVQRIAIMPTDGGDAPFQNILIQSVTIKE